MTRDDESRPTANEVRQATDFTANAISNRFGLDVERVRGVLERTEYEGQNSAPNSDYRENDDLYTYLFVPSLAEALDYLQPEKALILFEKEDLELLNRRATALRYLFGRLAPLYSLSELQQVTKLFISYLERNRDHILKTGLPMQPFKRSPLLEALLSPLYFIKKPISSHIADSNENGDSFYQYIWGAGNDESSIKECSYDEAPVLEILTPAEARYLVKSRSKLFDLKMRVLRNLLESLQTGETANLFVNSVRFLVKTHHEYELEPYINADNAYIGAKIYLNGNPTVWHRPVTGGITDLLEIIGHYEKELTIGTFAKTRKALGQIISFDRLRYAPSKVSEIISPYFKYVALGVKEELDIALDLFYSLQVQEDDFWKEYRYRVGVDLKKVGTIVFAEGPDVRFCVEVTQADETSRRVSYVTTAPAEHANELELHLGYFADYFKRHLEAFGQVPKPPPFHLTDTPTVSENVFRKEGEIWRITFEAMSISLPDAKGMQYISYLIDHAKKPFHVLELTAGLQGIPPESADVGRKDITYELLKEFWEGMQKQREKDPNSRSAFEDDTKMVLDFQAQREIRNRLKWLEEKLDEALLNNDLGRANNLTAEKEAIIEQLGKASSLGGKSRKFSDEGEKARKRVQASISRSLKRIEKEHPDLWRHLYSSIRTGYYCAYVPLDDIEWA